MAKQKAMFNLGIIGCGYWGPNIIRNFSALEGVEVISVCDKNPAALSRVKKNYENY